MEAARVSTGRRYRRCLHAVGAGRAIELLCVSVLLQHPQVHRITSRPLSDGSCCATQQLGTNTGPPPAVEHMQIVDQAAPPRIVIERDMDKAHQLAVILGKDRVSVTRYGEPRRPHRTTITFDVAIKERVGVRAPIMPAPTVGVQQRNLFGIVDSRRTKPQRRHENTSTREHRLSRKRDLSEYGTNGIHPPRRGLPDTHVPSLVLTRGTPPTNRRVAGQQAGATRWHS